MPNQYLLHGHGLHITYVTFVPGPVHPGDPGPPTFVYQDAQQTLTFHSPDVQVVDTELGQVVSVRIRMTVDQGSTTFSLLLPRVNVSDHQPVPIRTEGITALHRFALAPGLAHGQQDFYTVTPLHGTAADVIVPL
jgi:hypothetical protein